MLDLINDSDQNTKSNLLSPVNCEQRMAEKSNGEVNHNSKSLVHKCHWKNCESKQSRDVKLFKFPQPCSIFLQLSQNGDSNDAEISTDKLVHETSKCPECSRSQKWIDSCCCDEDLDTISTGDFYICSLHFHDQDKGPTKEYPDPMESKSNGTSELSLLEEFEDDKIFTEANLDDGISLTDDLENQLWETNELGVSTSRGLLLSLYLCISKHFEVKSRMDHVKLQFGQFKILSEDDESSERFLKFTSSETSSSKRIASVNDSKRCPIVIFEAFISHRPPCACKPDSPLYLQPERDCSGPVWFTAMALGKNKLSGMLSQAIKQSIQTASKSLKRSLHSNNNNNSTIKLKITNLSTGKPVIVDTSENGTDPSTRQKLNNTADSKNSVTFRKILPRSAAPILSKLEMEIKKENDFEIKEDKSDQLNLNHNQEDPDLEEMEQEEEEEAVEEPQTASPPITHRYNTRRKGIQHVESTAIITKSPPKRNKTPTDPNKVAKKRVKVDLFCSNIISPASPSSEERKEEEEIVDDTPPKPNYRILTSLLQSNEGAPLTSSQELTSPVDNSDTNLNSISLLDDDDEVVESDEEEKPLQIMFHPERESVELDQKSEDELSNLKIELRKSDICPGRSIKLEIKAILGLACGENNKSPQHITELLWQCGALGDKGPWLLVFSMWWLIQNYVGVGSRMNHVKLRWSHVELISSEDEGEYLLYRGPSNFISSKTAILCKKIFPNTAKNAQGVGPDFVHLYKLYRDRRLETSLKSDSPFYLQPLQGSAMVRKQKIWYGDSPLGKNRIGALMRNIIEKVVRPYLTKKGTKLPPRYQSNGSSKTMTISTASNSKPLVSNSSQAKKNGVISTSSSIINSHSTINIPNKVSLLKPKLIQPLPAKSEDGFSSDTVIHSQVKQSMTNSSSMLTPTLQLQLLESPDTNNPSKPTVVQLVQVTGSGPLLLSSSASSVMTENKQSLVVSSAGPTQLATQKCEAKISGEANQMLSLQLRQDDSAFPTPTKPMKIPKFLALPEGIVRTFTCDSPVPQPPKGHLKSLGDYINQSINYQSDNFREHLNALWSRGALGVSNPWSLNFSTWFINTLVFGVESRNEHLKLCWGDFVLSKTSEGREFIYFVNRVTGEAIFLAGNLPGKTPPGEVCPLEIFKTMRDHRPPTMLHPGARFYLQPRSVVQLKGNVPWFTETGWGKNKLGGLMSDAAQMANLPFSWLRKRRARNYFPGSKAATLLQAETSNLPSKNPINKTIANNTFGSRSSDILELLAAPKVGEKCGSAAVWMITGNSESQDEPDDLYTAKITLEEMEEAFAEHGRSRMDEESDDDDEEEEEEDEEDDGEDEDSMEEDESKLSPKTLELSGEPNEGEEIELVESFDMDSTMDNSQESASNEKEVVATPSKIPSLYENSENVSKSAKKRKNSTPLKLFDDPEPDW